MVRFLSRKPALFVLSARILMICQEGVCESTNDLGGEHAICYEIAISACASQHPSGDTQSVAMSQSNSVLSRQSQCLHWHEIGFEGAGDESATVFVQKPSDDLYCPICAELMRSAVTLHCTPKVTHVFCRRCITRQVDMKRCCPLDRNPAVHAQLKPNKGIEKKVQDLRIRCRYGCRAAVRDSAMAGTTTNILQQSVSARFHWEPVSKTDKDSKHFCPAVIPWVTRSAHEDVCPFKTELNMAVLSSPADQAMAPSGTSISRKRPRESSKE